MTLPAPVAGVHVYRNVRDRASYAFATVSVAAILIKEGGRITGGRLAFGGLAHKPWRVEAAEREIGRGADAVSEIAPAGARPSEHNAFKLPLVRRTLAVTVAEATQENGRSSGKPSAGATGGHRLRPRRVPRRTLVEASRGRRDA